MKIYSLAGIVLAIVFAITGLLFLFVPDQVLILFNTLSTSLGMPASPVTGWNFYLILTVGYMYVVTVLAFLMYRYPENKYFPQLLAQAKIVSSLLSMALFLFHAHYLIYLSNFIIDGLIGIAVITLYVRQGKLVQWASY
jgi:hypothetical protein